MNKTILIIFFAFLVFKSTLSQVAIFYADNPSVSINDTEINVEGRETDVQVKELLKIKNTSDAPIDVRVVRKRLVFGSSDDLLCYAGECYSTTDPDDPDVYTFPVVLSLESMEESEFEPGFFPGFQKFCAKHVYEIYNDANDALISSLTINFNIGMESCELNTSDQLPKVKNNLTLFPNPSSGYITLKDYDEGSVFELIDVLGKAWLRESLNGQVYTINIQDIPNGVYFYKLTNKYGVSSDTQKLVIKK